MTSPMCCWGNSILKILVATCLFNFGQQAHAQAVDAPNAKEKEAAAANQDGQLLDVSIVAVKGFVQVRANDDAKWQRATPGLKIAVGWEIRTGIRSMMQFKIGDDHLITVDRLGNLKVLDAIRTNGKVKTDLGLKYGRTKYLVDAVAEEHDSTVHAPSATLAIRGSEVIVSDNDAFGYAAVVGHSKDINIHARGLRRLPPIVMQRGTIEGKRPPTTAQFEGNDKSPTGSARTALAYARTGAAPDAIGGARGGVSPAESTLTRSEFQSVINNFGDSADSGGTGGGLTKRQRQTIKQQIQQNSTPPATINFTALDISIQWVGQANVDLGLRDPSNTVIATSQGAFGNSVQTVRPGGPAEGNAGPDDFGTGGSGAESILFSAEHFVGSYTVFLRFDQNNSTQPANVQVKVTQDDPNAPSGFKVLRDVSGTLSPGNLNFAVPFNAPVVQGSPNP